MYLNYKLKYCIEAQSVSSPYSRAILYSARIQLHITSPSLLPLLPGIVVLEIIY